MLLRGPQSAWSPSRIIREPRLTNARSRMDWCTAPLQWPSAARAARHIWRRIRIMDKQFQNVAITINGQVVKTHIEPRMLLIQFIRERAGLTGSHVGCDTSY